MGFSQSKNAVEIEPYDPAKNPYRAHHYWPPDLTQMSPRAQFKLEKRYKRRTSRATFITRQPWQRGTRLAQIVIAGGFTIYMVFFHNFDEFGLEGFDELRGWTRSTLRSIWSKSASEMIPRAGEEQRRNRIQQNQSEEGQ